MNAEWWIISFLGAISLSMFSFLMGRVSVNRRLDHLANEVVKMREAIEGKVNNIDKRVVRLETKLNGTH